MTTSAPPDIACVHCGHAFAGDIDIPSSPVPHLVSTNATPSESELALIQSTISASEFSLSQLDIRLNAILKEFRRKRRTLRRHTAVHKRLVSPMRHIPPEILAYIFTLCHPRWQVWYLDTEHSYAQRRLILLSHVSKYWRDVALSTPMLWSSLSVMLKADKSDRAKTMVETWLSRTGDTLLSLEIYCNDEVIGMTTHPVLDTIISYSHRWQNLKFALPIPLISALSPVNNNIHNLESLVALGHGNDDRTPDYYRALDSRLYAFEAAPKLRNLRMGYRIVPSMFAAPWKTLTKCHIFISPSSEVQEALSLISSGNLIDCALTIAAIVAIEPIEPLEMPHLIKFNIYADQDPAPIFNALFLPSLHTFTMTLNASGEDEHEWVWHESLVSLISRSSCCIRSLVFSFKHLTVHDETLIRCLQAMPALESLVLECDDSTGCLTDNLLLRLTNRDAEPCLTPALTHFGIDLSHIDLSDGNFDDGTLIEMIRSRLGTSDNLDDNGLSDGRGCRVARLISATLVDAYLKLHPVTFLHLLEMSNEYRIDLGSVTVAF